MQPLKKILPNFAKSHGIANQLRIRKVLEVVEKVLIGLWGAERAAYITPLSFVDGCLKLEATSAAAMQQFQVEQTRFINEINRQLGGMYVKKIHIRSKGF
ncbi:MAG: DUF721 domain-containing protein [Patescibacteria group bacterium]|nr:DUF721 domain-containing protein [Patescibacteria group bacterium]MBU2508994.1 DUF721 domain-containing protein [Patescibacteria group bacterium]